MSDLDSDADADGEHITLMTVHSAKGLEFKTVFVVGLEEELFPNQCAQSSLRELEEERRLLYVAITRAKDHCFLTFAKSRYKFGQFTYCEPSRFINEISPAYMAMQGGVQRPAQQQGALRGGGLFGRTNSYGSQQRAAGGGASQQGGGYHSWGGSSYSQPAQSPRREPEAPSFTQRPANLRRVADVQHSYGAPAGNTPSLGAGLVVQHDRFGVGQVLSTEGVGENAKATIKFQNAGVKTLLLKFAKLKVIG